LVSGGLFRVGLAASFHVAEALLRNDGMGMFGRRPAGVDDV
jgi:hypothetical protein